MINPDSNNFEKATLDPSANMRDHFANERTFLVWIRTSIAMMGFGFVIVKCILFIKQISLFYKNHYPLHVMDMLLS